MTMLLAVLALLSSVELPIVEAELIGQCEDSHIAVYASGFAHFEVSNSCGTAPDRFRSGLRKVSAGELAKLKATFAEARVDSLPASIEPPDGIISGTESSYGIRLWRKGVMKEVNAYALDAAADKEAARRFEMVWDAVQQFGPEAK